jgi:hypothetical protein
LGVGPSLRLTRNVTSQRKPLYSKLTTIKNSSIKENIFKRIFKFWKNTLLSALCPYVRRCYYFSWGWTIGAIYGSIDSLWPKDLDQGRIFFKASPGPDGRDLKSNFLCISYEIRFYWYLKRDMSRMLDREGRRSKRTQKVPPTQKVSPDPKSAPTLKSRYTLWSTYTQWSVNTLVSHPVTASFDFWFFRMTSKLNGTNNFHTTHPSLINILKNYREL